MPRYFVTWEIDADGATPVEAACHAFKQMRRVDSQACVFSVFDENGEETRVDFLELDDDGVIKLSEADPVRGALGRLRDRLESFTDPETAQSILDEVLRQGRRS